MLINKVDNGGRHNLKLNIVGHNPWFPIDRWMQRNWLYLAGI